MRTATAAILAVLLTIPSLVGAGTGPIINFDDENHDYGRIIYGDKVTHEFTVTNTGDEALTIGKVESTCGCTNAMKGSSEVPPHEKTHIIASFDTTGLKGGKTLKKVHVYSNDPKRPMVTLTVAADVVRELSVDPRSLARKIPPSLATLSFPLKVTNSSDKAVAIKGAKVQAGSLQVTLEPEHLVMEPRSTAPLTLLLKLKHGPNQYFWSGNVLLETDHPREKELAVHYLIQLNTD